MTTTRRTFLTQSLPGACWGTVALAAAPPRIPTGRRETLPPAAFIAAYDYQQWPEESLTWPVANTITLARVLIENGIEVTIVSDEASRRRIRDQFGDARFPKFFSADTIDSVAHFLGRWRTDHFGDAQKKAVYGLVAVNGHGVVREKGEFFLTPKDSFASGGLPIRRLLQDFATLVDSVFFVIDTCRTAAPTDPMANKPAAPPLAPMPMDRVSALNIVRQQKGMDVDVKGDRGDPQAVNQPVRFFATRMERAARDMRFDAFGALAEAMEAHVLESGTTTFVARRAHQWDDAALVPHGQSVTALPLFNWFKYAADKIGNYRQKAEFEFSGFDDMAVVADKGKPILETVPNLAVNLLSQWGQFFSGGYFESTSLPVGRKLTRPEMADTKDGWAAATFESSFDPVQKELVIECVAVPPGDTPAERIDVIFQPGQYGKHTQSFSATKGTTINGTLFSLPWNQPCRLLIPLTKVPRGAELTSLAVSLNPAPNRLETWVPNGSLLITRMALQGRTKATQSGEVMQLNNTARSRLDLTPLWWRGDNLCARRDVLVTTDVIGFGADRIFSLTAHRCLPRIDAGKGGPLYPQLFVSKEDLELEVIVEDFVPREVLRDDCNIAVIVEGADGLMLHEFLSVRRDGVRVRHAFSFQKSGFANYLAITTDAESVKFLSLALVRKKDDGV